MITELAITLGAGGVGTIVGFFTCAALTAGKVADLEREIGEACADYSDARVRCHDLREAIRELLNRPRTIRKGDLALILDGDGK